MTSSRLAIVVLVSASCFETTAPAKLYACNDDGTCPNRYLCDQAVDRPAVCCLPGVLPCPTLRSPDGLCEDGTAGRTYLRDRDGDGFGNANEQVIRCAQPVGFVAVGARPDCDDSVRTVNPDTAESCNGVDDNCDGVIDEGLSPRELFLRDEDGDGYPSFDGGGVLACEAPPGTVRASGAFDDCKPFDAARHPNAGELCNGIDDDCDDSILAARYADTQLLSEPVRLPCEVPNAKGICRDGVLTCLGGMQPVCTRLRDAGVEVCDGVDTDCDGNPDNQPGCGGPRSLVGQAGHTYGGGLVQGGTGLTDRCQKARVVHPGTNTMGHLTGSRPAEQYLVWWVEAPAGVVWDLSAENLRLNLAWTASGTNPDATQGLWGVPGTGVGQAGVHPVVYLCGEQANALVRFRWKDVTTAFSRNETSFSGVLHLDPNQPDGGFVLGVGSGFDTRRVRRIEVMIPFFGTTYDWNMSATTGFEK